MSEEFPSVEFTNLAYFDHQDGDIAYIRIAAMRTYEIEVTLSKVPGTKAALESARRFFSPEEIFTDVLNLGQLLTRLPMVLPTGYTLPTGSFCESPLADPVWHTFETDYYLQFVACPPTWHIDTGISLFPPSVYACLVIDARIAYSRVRRTRLPDLIPHYVREDIGNGYIGDYPEPDETTATVPAFQRYLPSYGYDTCFCYVDSVGFFRDIPYNDEAREDSILFAPHAMRLDTGSGRYYYYATNDPSYPQWNPFKGIYPLPPASRRLVLEFPYQTEWGGRQLVQLTALNLPAFYYPEYTALPPISYSIPHQPPPRRQEQHQRRQGILIGTGSMIAVQRTWEWSGLIDGSWRVGLGGHKIR